MRSNVDRAVVRCGLWLHAGYAGLVVVAAGLIRLLALDAGWLSALLLILCGSVLAAACWRRAWIVLDQAEWASSALEDASEKPAPRASNLAAGRGRVIALSHARRRSKRRFGNAGHDPASD